MSELNFNGQTDEVIQINLPSQIVGVSWKVPSIATAGVATIEVQTLWVGEGSSIEIDIINGEGKKVETLTGKVYSNLFRKKYPIPTDPSGELFFTAKLKDHQLEESSNSIEVLPSVEISELKVLDEEGQELEKISKEKVLTFEAQIDGPPDESEVTISLFCQTELNDNVLQFSKTKLLKEAKVSLEEYWTFPKKEQDKVTDKDVKKDGESYFEPYIYFEVECFGTKVLSKNIPYTSWVVFNFGEQKGEVDFLLPDGTEVTKTTDSDGKIELEAAAVGKIEVLDDRTEIK